MAGKIQILSTGTELTTGRIVDTNGPELARELTDLGYAVAGIRTTPDDDAGLEKEIRELLDSPEISLVIMTGGLGPTDDDHTVDVLSRIFD